LLKIGLFTLTLRDNHNIINYSYLLGIDKGDD